MPERRAVFYDVPAGTRPTTCRGPNCGATMYWVETPWGSRVPVSCDVEGGQRPSEAKAAHAGQGDMFSATGTAEVFDGRGVSHFTNCADVDLFSRDRAKAVRHG